MAKLNTYNIPVDLIKSIGLKVDAVNETEAVKEAIKLINDRNYLKDTFTEYKIQEESITCDQDNEIIEEVAKDFNLDIKVINPNRDLVTHTVSTSKIEK